MASRSTSKRDIGPVVKDHVSREKILDGLVGVLNDSPRDSGLLQEIVIRPAENQRKCLQNVRLSPKGGLEGDRWALGCWKKQKDGRPHPDVQVAIMNSRFIDLIAKSKEFWPLAGDNLYVDLHLSEEYLAVGQFLRIGTAIIQITAQPHLACRKFALRFGFDAARIVNTEMGKYLRLRGVYARVVIAGLVEVGDKLEKVWYSDDDVCSEETQTGTRS